MTQQAIDLFEEAHPNITVVPEFSPYTDYWDKLSTTVAGGDAPDVMQQVDPFIYEYVDSGLLADLSDYAEVLPLDNFDEGALEGSTIDGGVYGVPGGVGAFGVAIDPQAFAEAGIEVPDDATWTWDDYADIAAELSEKLGPSVYGSTLPLDEQAFNMYVRQRGEDLWTPDDATVGFTEDTAAAWWAYVLDLRDSGATPSASLAVEQASLGLEQSPLATHTAAMTFLSANQIDALQNASGRDLDLLLFPGESDEKRPGSYVKPGVYYSVSAKSEHPTESAMLIDFIVNTVEVGEILRTDRGVPGNSEVLAAIGAELSPAERKLSDYVTKAADISVAGFPKPNLDAGPELVPLFARLNQQVIFDQITPDEAAQQFIAELEAAM
jgi:multiple sugar transport system substrate-binding protein